MSRKDYNLSICVSAGKIEGLDIIDCKLYGYSAESFLSHLIIHDNNELSLRTNLGIRTKLMLYLLCYDRKMIITLRVCNNRTTACLRAMSYKVVKYM